jgi:glutamyl/glutaminyl-tRNA synthetase
MTSWHGYYDGHCRNRGLTWKVGRRLRVELPNEPVEFIDSVMGRQTQRPAEFRGDPELRNPLGNWTYRFAVVVDDHRHGVNTVIRGKGILDLTPGQILLAQMLGWEAPVVWVHHNEIMDTKTGTKLSKRRGAPSVGQMMDAGITPYALLGKAAASIGLSSDRKELDPKNLADLFT